ncbi:MAG TPA: DUF2846 domain-containing protein [Pyrinomonadaceae bacterium]|nr:DUF2846 domain-containing protein [Pyrinomonadaceae bacterium]
MNHHIKRVPVVILAACLLFSNFSIQSATIEDEIVVTEGTPLVVVTAHEVTSKLAKPNDTVKFTVNEDLVVNGQVVVRKGTEAVGSVVTAQKGGYMGNSGKLAIAVESTTTVDGQPLKLRAAKGREGNDKTTSTYALATFISPLFLFKRGGDAKITTGMPITVYTAEEKRFRLEGSTLVAVAPATPPVVSNEDAVVYIYRPKSWVGRGLEPSVYADGTELARMDNGRYFALRMKPGKHIVHMTDEKKGYAIDMGPGQTYFFRIGLEAGMWKGQGKILLDEAERGIKEVKKIKFIGQDKIKAPTIVVDIPLK